MFFNNYLKFIHIKNFLLLFFTITFATYKIYKMKHQTFNLQKIIDYYDLDRNEVEKALFPHIRYQKQALDNALTGQRAISVEQLQALADLAGVFIQDLFAIDTWKGFREDNCLTFVKGEFKVKINYNGTYLTLLKDNKIVLQEMASQDRTLEEFLKHITFLTNKFKKQ